jgi:hypothetical protein
MKTITFTFLVLIATTTLAHAGSIENRCWSKATQYMTSKGCQFGNDFAPHTDRCLKGRKIMYSRCLWRAQTVKRIRPAHGVPVNQTTNLRYK